MHSREAAELGFELGFEPGLCITERVFPSQLCLHPAKSEHRGTQQRRHLQAGAYYVPGTVMGTHFNLITTPSFPQLTEEETEA